MVHIYMFICLTHRRCQRFNFERLVTVVCYWPVKVHLHDT